MDFKIAKLSKTQEEISESFVSNHIEEIETVFNTIRDVFDSIWEDPLNGNDFLSLRKRIHEYKEKLPLAKLTEYPEGFCFPITNFFYQLLTKHLVSIDPDFKRLDDYLNQEGVLKIVWGDLREVYFQTALQLGGWYIDVAYDAIDRNKPKVRCAKFEDSGFKDITSIEQYISIKEQYHEGKMCLNTIFPKLFSVHPFIFLQHNGVIVFDESKLLKELVVCDNYEGLISYLNSNQVNILPTEVYDRISNKLFSIQQPLIRDLATYKLSSIEELVNGLQNNQINFSYLEEDYKKVCQALTFLLR